MDAKKAHVLEHRSGIRNGVRKTRQRRVGLSQGRQVFPPQGIHPYFIDSSPSLALQRCSSERGLRGCLSRVRPQRCRFTRIKRGGGIFKVSGRGDMT